MLRTVKQKLNLQNFVLVFVSVVATVAILIALSNMSTTRSALIELEIKTIVGANTNTDMNYQIHSLFLKSILSSKTNADKLSNFIANSISNIENEIQALANTEMANAPVESMEK